VLRIDPVGRGVRINLRVRVKEYGIRVHPRVRGDAVGIRAGRGRAGGYVC